MNPRHPVSTLLTVGAILAGAGGARAAGPVIRSTITIPYETAGKILRIVYHSPLLKRNRAALVYLPPGYDAAAASNRRYATLYFLHGYPGSIQDWIERGNAQQTLDRKIQSGQIEPMLAVFAAGDGPDGHLDNDAYLNRADGRFPLEDAIVQELVPLIDRTYRTQADATSRALIGLSEGGFAAANLTVRHPDVFHVAVSHSGYFDATADAKTFRAVLGAAGPLWEQNSPLRRIETLRDPRALHFFLGAGTRDEDHVADDARGFAAVLQRLGVDCELRIADGKHSWNLWGAQLSESLDFVNQAMVGGKSAAAR